MSSTTPGTLLSPAPPRITRRHFLIALGITLAAAPLAACGRPTDPNAPPTIRYGEDVCVACGMIISDPAFASAYRTTSGDVRLFDDLGEMIAYHRQRREAVAVFFVHDYDARVWLRAEDAFYVSSRSLRTPMGFGVVALASEPAARALVDRVGGQALSFQDLLEHAELSGSGGRCRIDES